MTMPYRAIISDLDGTLLNAEHKIGKFTIETLEKLAARGVDIFIATGRNYPDVSHLISKITVKDAMLITANGARANKLNGEKLVQHHLPEEIALALMNLEFDRKKACVNSYQGDEWFINIDIPKLREFHNESGYGYEVVDFSRHHGKLTEKIFYIARQAADLLPIEQKIHALYGDQIQTTYSTPLCFEAMAKGVNKANTLAEVVQLRGYTLADCIAFGDGMNDVEMLAKAGKGCIMQNADPRLAEKLPQLERIGHHKDEAVAHYIQILFDL